MWAQIFHLVSSVRASERWLPLSGPRSTARAGVPISPRKGRTDVCCKRQYSSVNAAQRSVLCEQRVLRTIQKFLPSLQICLSYRVPQDSLTGQPEVMSVLTQTALCLRNFACSCFTVVLL